MHSTSKTAIADLRDGIRLLYEKIALLPECQQKQLRELVDKANQECSTLHHTCAALRDSVDDLHLATRFAEFEIAATTRELQQARRASGWG